MRTLKFILLPILGVLAAVIAFRMAAPFADSLNRPDLSADDPRALFTYGTKWGEVNRIAFGALLCGPFAVVLALGRRSPFYVMLAGAIGAVLGGCVNFVTDSSADLIGIAVSKDRAGAGPMLAMLAWCVLVPLGIAITLLIAQGFTTQRIRRAVVAFKYAVLASLAVQILGGMLASQSESEDISLQSQIPVWQMVEITVGLAFGLTLVLADEYVRTGTIRLMHGKNEYVDWSLDHTLSRIGSAEGCEIYVRGFQGVEPVHALIQRHGDHFILEPRAPTQVNGMIVGLTQLNSRDVITVGNAQLVFIASGAAALSPASSQQVVLSALPQPRILQDAVGRQIPLPPGRYGIGRDETNAICLHFDPQVSPNHAEIYVTDAGITVADLRSSTGTKRNGLLVTAPTPLTLGDTLEVGSHRFTYVR